MAAWRMEQRLIQMERMLQGGGMGGGNWQGGMGHSHIGAGGAGPRGGYQGQGGTAGQHANSCQRCGGRHLQTQCPIRLKGHVCQNCHKLGHTKQYCRSKAIDDIKCSCCGVMGHIKKECPHNTDQCTRCLIKGHTVAVCRHPPGFTPQQRKGPQAAARTSPPPVKTQAAAVPTGSLAHSYLCGTCGTGVWDPDDKATHCPISTCKAQRTKTATKEEKSKTSLLGTFTKHTKETLELVKGVTAAGGLPPQKQDQENAEKVVKLRREIGQLENIDGDYTAAIETKKKELTKLEKKVAPVACQPLMDQTRVLQAMSEIEEKHMTKENDLKDKLEKQRKLQTAIVTDGAKARKEMEEEAARKLKELDENVKTRAAEAAEAVKEAEANLESLHLEKDELLKTIQDKAGSITQQVARAAAAVTGVALVPTLPGRIVHSNDLTPEAVSADLHAAPSMAGLSEDQVQAVVTWTMNLMNRNSSNVPALSVPNTALQQAAAGAAEANNAMDTTLGQEKRPLEEESASKDDETDYSGTDTEDDMKCANEGKGSTPMRKKKKGTKAQAAEARTKKQVKKGDLK